jgi:D-alanyl-D-alanine carboxypeptidase
MKTTVPVKNAPAGSGYGLGLTSSATSCGRVAWGHDGAFGGYYSLSYSSNDGRHQAMLMVNLDQTSQTKRVSTLFYKLIDKAYCAAFASANS